MNETTATSIRLPNDLLLLAIQREHPRGVSGVVCDALRLYLSPPSDDEAAHALDVLQRTLRDRKVA